MEVRSKFFGTFIGAALAAALVAPVSAQTVIKVGVITTYSGPLAPPGLSMDRGLSLYAKLHAKDLPPGVTVEILRRDDTGPNPDVAKRLAQELVTRDQVNFLAGVVYSPNGFAVAPIAAEAKVPFIDMNAAASPITRIALHGPRFLHALAGGLSDGPVGGEARHEDRPMIAVSDYAPGNDADGGFAKGFTDGGGQMLDTVKLPAAEPRFRRPSCNASRTPSPRRCSSSCPGGPQSTQMMKAYNDLGLKKAGITLVTTQDLAMPTRSCPIWAMRPWAWSTREPIPTASARPANLAFLDAWTKEYGDKDIADFPPFRAGTAWR